MMNLEIRGIVNNNTKQERVVLKVLADCNLKEYLLFDSTYDENGMISNKQRHMFVFPDQMVKKGDYVWLHTGCGKEHVHDNTEQTKTYNLYWEMDCSVWNNDGDTVHLIHYDGYVNKNVKKVCRYDWDVYESGFCSI